MLKPLTINLPEETVAWLKEKAKADFDSLSRTVAKIINKEYVSTVKRS